MRSLHALVSLTIVLGAAAVSAQTAAPDNRSEPRVSRKIDMLDDWIDAARAHRPGAYDESLERTARLRGADLDQIWIHLRSVMGLIAEPFSNTFTTGVPGSTRRIPVVYSRNELRRLREIAVEARRDGSANGLLKRGALLHGDVAILRPEGEAERRSSDSRLNVMTLRMTDGQKAGLETDVSHMQLARNLLDAVQPSPAADESVRLWYRATLAHMLLDQQYGLPHFARAAEIYPNDPEILLLQASLHEAVASPGVQAAVRDADLPRTVTLHVESRDNELKKAERLFRQVLAADAAVSDAKIGLGHVVGQLGRHQEAADLLRTAATNDDRPSARYHAALFLGNEAAALDRRDDARTAYMQAAAIFPRAQSPRIGLSQIALRSGQPTLTASAFLAALTLADEERDLTDDPWWGYYLEAGRRAPEWLMQAAEAMRVIP